LSKTPERDEWKQFADTAAEAQEADNPLAEPCGAPWGIRNSGQDFVSLRASLEDLNIRKPEHLHLEEERGGEWGENRGNYLQHSGGVRIQWPEARC